MLRILVVNDQTGETFRGPSTSGYTDDLYTVTASEGQSEFVVTQSTVTELNPVDVFLNGVLLTEGLTEDYIRDVENNRIDLNYVVGQGSKLRVRVY